MIEPSEIGRVVLGSGDTSGGLVAPEEDGHVREGGRGDELAGRAVRYLLTRAVRQLRIIDRNGRSEARALRAAHVHGR